MNPDDFGINYDVMVPTWDDDNVFDVSASTITGALTVGALTEVRNEITIEQGNGDRLEVAATIRQQTYEIEALTDIIKEMVTKQKFDVELDIEKRVEQKKFLRKLGETPSGI